MENATLVISLVVFVLVWSSIWIFIFLDKKSEIKELKESQDHANGYVKTLKEYVDSVDSKLNTVIDHVKTLGVLEESIAHLESKVKFLGTKAHVMLQNIFDLKEEVGKLENKIEQGLESPERGSEVESLKEMLRFLTAKEEDDGFSDYISVDRQIYEKYLEKHFKSLKHHLDEEIGEMQATLEQGFQNPEKHLIGPKLKEKMDKFEEKQAFFQKKINNIEYIKDTSLELVYQKIDSLERSIHFDEHDYVDQEPSNG